jgi:hypothetical protein
VRRLLDTREAAAALGVPAAAIRDWKTRKRVIPAELLRGRGRGGRVPLWDLADLEPLAEAYKARVATRRKTAD